jgi:hypothetical protein
MEILSRVKGYKKEDNEESAIYAGKLLTISPLFWQRLIYKDFFKHENAATLAAVSGHCFGNDCQKCDRK